MSATTCHLALKQWEAEPSNGPAEDATDIRLYCQTPPIAKMDNSLNTLKNCEQLSLSTNCIERMIPLAGMKKLRILSMGRNQIRRIEKLDENWETLQELWFSYNLITQLSNLTPLKNLEVLYVGNNQIKSWDEVMSLRELEKLRDVLFVGNPIYEKWEPQEARIRVLHCLPNVSKIDGGIVKGGEREEAAELEYANGTFSGGKA